MNKLKTGIKIGILGGSHSERKILEYVEQSVRGVRGINPQPRSVDEAMWDPPAISPLASPQAIVVRLKPKTLRGRFVAWLSRILRAT